MSRQEFRLPDVGEGLTEAEVVAWRVAPGDAVSLASIATSYDDGVGTVEVALNSAHRVSTAWLEVDGQRHRLELSWHGAVLGDECRMWTALDDPAPVEDDHLVGRLRRRQAVRDRDRGAPAGHRVEGPLQANLGRRVDRADTVARGEARRRHREH